MAAFHVKNGVNALHARFFRYPATRPGSFSRPICQWARSRRRAHVSDQRATGIDCSPAELIAAIAQSGDRQAFAALFDFYAPRIKTMLIRRGAPADLAEDLAQETLVTVWRKAAYFDAAKANPSAWVYAIARHLLIDEARRDQRGRGRAHFDVDDREAPPTPHQVMSDLQSGERVRAALRKLSKDQLRVVELSFFEGRPHGAIANLLGLPIGTVKSRLRLAAARLRELLGDVV
ncbi:MAG: sigma-70 family RNA polymerase sigma factor [Methylobacteriaceae bacterium]|nr:sigma-70 family RNA polymerase sigma factor [Methylobacteriaceae bacterium]